VIICPPARVLFSVFVEAVGEDLSSLVRRHFRWLVLLFSFLMVACYDHSTDVNVSPEAEAAMPQILKAVDDLNAAASGPIYTVKAVSSGERVDGEIIIRIGKTKDTVNGPALGLTHSTRFGVIITLLNTDVTSNTIAHELGHAAGLGHVEDKGNLMYPYEEAKRKQWLLTAGQVKEMWGTTE